MNDTSIQQGLHSLAIADASIDLIDNFIKDQDTKDSSKVLYQRTLRIFLRWIQFNKLHLVNINRADIIRYKQELLDSGLSSLTVGSYITAVKKFYEWSESNKYYPNVAKGIKTPKRYKGFKKDTLSINQIVELLDSIDSSSLQGKRDYAILNLMIRTGLRAIEVARADVGDIAYKGDELVLYVMGKGRDEKDNFVILTAKAYTPIMEYIRTRGNCRTAAPLFTSLSNNSKGKRLTTRSISFIAKSHFKDIGLDSSRLTCHSLRHTACINVLKAGGDIYSTQLFMRHASPSTTEIYLRTIEEEMRLKNAPEKLLENMF